MPNGNSIDLDLVEQCKKYDLNPTHYNDVSGMIAHVSVKEIQGKYGPWPKASIKLDLSLPVEPGYFEHVTGWFSVLGFNFKKGKEIDHDGFERHVQGFRDRIGHSIKFCINNLKFSGVPIDGSETGEMEITVNIEALSMPGTIIVGGVPNKEETPVAQPALAPQQQTPTQRPAQPPRTQPTPQVQHRPVAPTRGF